MADKLASAPNPTDDVDGSEYDQSLGYVLHNESLSTVDMHQSIGSERKSIGSLPSSSSSSSSFDESSKSSTMVSIINLSQQFIGAGLLSIPWGISKGSLYPSIIILILNALYDMTTAIFLVNGCEKLSIFEYSSLFRRIGPKWEFCSAVSILYVAGSTLITFLILIGDFVSNILGSFESVPSFQYDRQCFIVVVVIVVILPLSLLRSLRALKYWSILCNLANLYIVGLLLYLTMHRIWSDGMDSLPMNGSKIDYVRIDFGVLILNNIAAKSFVVHLTVPNMYQELEGRSVSKFVFIFGCSNVVVICLYLLFGVCGYLLFGDVVSSDITNNLEDSVYTLVARIAMTISIIGTYPFVFKALFTTFTRRFCKETPSGNTRNAIVVLLVAMTVIVPLLVDDVGVVASIEGAVSVLGILCVFPIALIWHFGFASHSESEREYRASINYLMVPNMSSHLTLCQKVVLVIMLTIGIVLGSLGIFAQIYVNPRVYDASDSASECVGFDESCTPNESNCCDVDGSKSACSEFFDGYYCFPVEPISARHEGSNLDQIRKGILVYSSIFC